MDTTIVTASRRIVIGAGTHLEKLHLAVITNTGEALADAEFPKSPAGYDKALKWAQGFGTIQIAGVQGTSEHRADLTRVLHAQQIEVAELSGRAALQGQSEFDPLDAYAAARAAALLVGEGEDPFVQIRDPNSPPVPPSTGIPDPPPPKKKF
jgi:transposase